jgi:hypothetical protein
VKIALSSKILRTDLIHRLTTTKTSPQFKPGLVRLALTRHCFYKRSGGMIKRLDGDVYQSKRTAEDHGVELGKQWIDENPNKE